MNVTYFEIYCLLKLFRVKSLFKFTVLLGEKMRMEEIGTLKSLFFSSIPVNSFCFSVCNFFVRSPPDSVVYFD
jgi:hypothetical protein